MNIVFIGPFGLQPKGTMSVRALPLAKALVASGHAVTLLLPPWDDPARSGQSWMEEGVQVINLALPRRGLLRLPLLFHIALTYRLVAQALALQPDVVHCFKPKAYAGLVQLVLWWLRRWRGRSLRLVVDADDWERAWNEVMPYSALQKKFFAWQEGWGLAHADAVTVASRALESLVTFEAQVDPAHVFYVPNGFQAAGQPVNSPNRDSSPCLSPASPSESGSTVLVYSRFAEFRLERLVTLVKEVTIQLPAARWLLVGRGLQGEEKMLAAKLAQAGLDRSVCFAGWVPVGQLPAYFEAAEVAIHLYDDTLLNRTKCSVKLIDLLAYGLPVVADAVGQNCEYIQQEQTGFLVPPEDDQAIAHRLVALLQDPPTRQRVGAAARQYIRENFSWADLAQTVEKAYR